MDIIIDTGTSNSFSIQRALKHLNFDAHMTNKPSKIQMASKIILPGVGNFDSAIQSLRNNDLIDPILDAALVNKIPILGICVGMQILFESSSEGYHKGLGLVPGNLKKLELNNTHHFKVPNTGFKEVKLNTENLINKGLSTREYFYFNHSYCSFDDNDFQITDWAEHTSKFVASFQNENIFGVQYHPEKSQLTGLKVLDNFMKL